MRIGHRWLERLVVTIALMGLSAAVWNVVWGVRKGGLTGEARADAGGAGEVNSVVSCGSSWVVWCEGRLRSARCEVRGCG